MVLSNVTVDVTISRCSFVLSQSRAKVSPGFTTVSSLAVAAFDLVYCSSLSSGLSLSLTLVGSRREVVISLCATSTTLQVATILVAMAPKILELAT